MPLHKSTRAPRLDPTMISAPLGDFRHTMHIGRGGDAFGDTSFLSTLGPSQANPDAGSPPAVAAPDDAELTANHSDGGSELQHSESLSSFTLDLDLDLGPSMLGEVLGVMDGLGLEEDVFSSKSGGDSPESAPGNGATETSVNLQNELNGKDTVGLDGNQVGDSRIPDGNGIKPKGLKPKVRFSDKREEIIRQASEEDEGQAFDFQEESEPAPRSPTEAEGERAEGQPAPTAQTAPAPPAAPAAEGDTVNHKEDLPPSPVSSHSSEYDGATPLDRRRVDNCQSETDSEEEGEEGEEEEEEEEEEGGGAGRGYTFEDEFDDEIGL